MIRDIMKRNYQAVEEAFYDLDENNTRRLSQETMYQLLKRYTSVADPESGRGGAKIFPEILPTKGSRVGRAK